ncbi:MAG: sigma-70 family RNA polymerase sigma factor [Candidatus Pseudobacter hemicellulosilyticus]|uniref:Sigma-70 family RNA polymerase sigma factor n=1 Tax=Candidatus Pseudobacter hemicellulosilyticus TaxID=3121375 RepID=A0AAJ6BFC2_9BACT|nr:MAG: sigma-70 family RNA polymerase sigma factor [Pseudobacter sp.]
MDLVPFIKAGSETHFNQAYLDHHESLYFFITGLTRNGFLAEEVVQQTFIRCWTRRQQLSDEHSLPEQLFRMARTILIDELRKENTRQKHLYLAGQPEDGLTSEPSLPEGLLRKDLEQALSSLPASRRRIFRMSRLQGYSHKEIAGILSLSPKTVENQIGKTLRQLRQFLSFFC